MSDPRNPPPDSGDDKPDEASELSRREALARLGKYTAAVLGAVFAGGAAATASGCYPPYYTARYFNYGDYANLGGSYSDGYYLNTNIYSNASYSDYSDYSDYSNYYSNYSNYK